MKIWILVFGLCLIATFAYAETYTGSVENVRANERGVQFVVVVKDGRGAEVLRREQWISTGNYIPAEVENAIKNVVDKMTQEMWAHIEGAEEVLKNKTILEGYTTTCNVFVDPKDRPVVIAPRE